MNYSENSSNPRLIVDNFRQCGEQVSHFTYSYQLSLSFQTHLSINDLIFTKRANCLFRIISSFFILGDVLMFGGKCFSKKQSHVIFTVY